MTGWQVALVLLVLFFIMLLCEQAKGQELTAEQRCLALNVYHEARAEPWSGKVAVAQVTLNRVKSKHYPKTICGVVYQYKQFSWTNWRSRRNRPIRPNDVPDWEKSVKATLDVLNGRADDYAKGALWFYNPRLAAPGWAKDYRVTARIGNHVFLGWK